MRYVAVFGLLGVLGCGLDRSPPLRLIHARFDPDAKKIPMPTDVLRDARAARLNLPIDDTLTDAEKEFFGFLNTLDGWSSTMTASVELSGKLDPRTITFETLQVWDLSGAVPARERSHTCRVSKVIVRGSSLPLSSTLAVIVDDQPSSVFRKPKNSFSASVSVSSMGRLSRAARASRKTSVGIGIFFASGSKRA